MQGPVHARPARLPLRARLRGLAGAVAGGIGFGWEGRHVAACSRVRTREQYSQRYTDTEQGGEGRTVALLGGEGGRRGGSCERWLLSETTTTTWLLRVPLEAAGGAREHGSDTATTGEKTSGSRLDGLRLSSCPQQLHHRPP
jgi:hypothetical protein